MTSLTQIILWSKKEEKQLSPTALTTQSAIFKSPGQLKNEHHVQSKHSMESTLFNESVRTW